MSGGLAAHEDALGAVSSRMVWLALLDIELQRRGLRVRAPLFAGGHAFVVFPDGSRVSVTMWERYVRVVALNAWRCEGCGADGAQSASCNGRRRDVRVDRRWCSPACRQRAYRQRQGRAS